MLISENVKFWGLATRLMRTKHCKWQTRLEPCFPCSVILQEFADNEIEVSAFDPIASI